MDAIRTDYRRCYIFLWQRTAGRLLFMQCGWQHRQPL